MIEKKNYRYIKCIIDIYKKIRHVVRFLRTKKSLYRTEASSFCSDMSRSLDLMCKLVFILKFQRVDGGVSALVKGSYREEDGEREETKETWRPQSTAVSHLRTYGGTQDLCTAVVQ